MTAIIVLSCWGVMAMMADALCLGKWVRWATGFGFIVAFAATFCSWSISSTMWFFDDTALMWTRLLIGFSAVLYCFGRHEANHHLDALMIFSLIGGVLMTSFSHVVMLFLAIEILSIPLYILAGSSGDEHSLEASMKYFILGSFASAILLFGVALGYAGIPVGAALVVIGLCFKIGVAPFHLWVPDVYEGSSLRYTAFMSIVVKLAAIAGLFRFLAWGFEYRLLLIGCAVISMIIGAFLALYQSSFKRWMAYSGIAHAGFMVVLVALGDAVTSSLFFYALTYGIGAIVVFGLVMGEDRDQYQMDSFRGLFFRRPWMATGLGFGLFSLAGIPPLPGFFAKFLVLAHAWHLGFGGIVGIALVGSLVSTFVYLKFVSVLFLKD